MEKGRDGCLWGFFWGLWRNVKAVGARVAGAGAAGARAAGAGAQNQRRSYQRGEACCNGGAGWLQCYLLPPNISSLHHMQAQVAMPRSAYPPVLGL
jgi:hypothetical protein